jgi:hypothetical protein
LMAEFQDGGFGLESTDRTRIEALVETEPKAPWIELAETKAAVGIAMRARMTAHLAKMAKRNKQPEQQREATPPPPPSPSPPPSAPHNEVAIPAIVVSSPFSLYDFDYSAEGTTTTHEGQCDARGAALI